MINNNQPVTMEVMKISEIGKLLKALMIEVFDERLEKALKKGNVQSDKPGFYEIKDICEMFRITPQTFHNWKNRGWIIGRKMGKSRFFTKEEVEQAMTNHQITKGKTPDSILLHQTPN